jgi:uncharacterized protein YidB (DUF937 family)/transcriptional regulator with XRE-family HTH domain
MDSEDSGAASDPLSLFCARLRRLQRQSGIKQADLLGAAGLKRSQVSDILNGKIERPPGWGVTIAIIRACLEHAKAGSRLVPPDLSDEADWQRRYFDLEQDLDTGARAKPRREEPAGRPLAAVTDPFALEVHHPVQPDGPEPGLPALPAYVAREHDAELARVVAAAAQGDSGVAVLVGGSSTGKTRACWEALDLLRDQGRPWRLWHPIDPGRPEAALRELPLVGPRTVVWLNEAQFYLDAPGGLGERIAAGLREALRDPVRAPVLVLATLWAQHWDALTVRPAAGADPHAQARQLLAGRDISVPAAFTAAHLRQLAGAADPRLAQAARTAEDGQVTQFLAGAPELMARYRNAPPAAAALISAAMDARRLGMGVTLQLRFLEAAAPGYLTDTDWDSLGEDWVEQALAYSAAPCKGIRGPLLRVRARPAGDPIPGPVYRLADYLEQHGRRARQQHFPPASFWQAAERFAGPADLRTLAWAAERRGLLRDAARLRRRAIILGDIREAVTLIRDSVPHRSPGLSHRSPGSPYLSAGPNPAQWVTAHARLDGPGGVAGLLDALDQADAGEQVTALLARNPAAHVSLRDPGGVAHLLQALRTAGAGMQVTALLARDPAARANLEDPGGVARLLHALRQADAGEQLTALLARDPAACARLDDLTGVAYLLGGLKQEAAEQATALAARAAAHARLDDPGGVAHLIEALRRTGEGMQVAALLARDPAASARLDDLNGVADLIEALWRADPKRTWWRADPEQQAAALSTRAAAHAALTDPRHIVRLLGAFRITDAAEQTTALLARIRTRAPFLASQVSVALREMGAKDQAFALDSFWPVRPNPFRVALARAGEAQLAVAQAAHAAAHSPLNDPVHVARLLDDLREAGAGEQVTALLARGPAAHASIDDPIGVALLLKALRKAGAGEQVTALLARDLAANVSLDKLFHVAHLLVVLREAGAEQPVTALAARAAAHGPLTDLHGVTSLLRALREAGTEESVTALAGRAAACCPLDNSVDATLLLRALREAGTEESVTALAGRAAACCPLDNSVGATLLLRALREAGTEEQVRTLVERLPAAGCFYLFYVDGGHHVQYRFGREPDGRPSPAWDWSRL